MDGKSGLSITFHEELNALIGENNSGKTAIIDALRAAYFKTNPDMVMVN